MGYFSSFLISKTFIIPSLWHNWSYCSLVNILKHVIHMYNVFLIEPRDKTFGDKLAYIPNDDKQIYSSHKLISSVEKLDTTTLEPSKLNLIRVPKVYEPTNKITRSNNFSYRCKLIKKSKVSSIPALNLSFNCTKRPTAKETNISFLFSILGLEWHLQW